MSEPATDVNQCRQIDLYPQNSTQETISYIRNLGYKVKHGSIGKRSCSALYLFDSQMIIKIQSRAMFQLSASFLDHSIEKRIAKSTFNRASPHALLL